MIEVKTRIETRENRTKPDFPQPVLYRSFDVATGLFSGWGYGAYKTYKILSLRHPNTQFKHQNRAERK